jgi:hypothetical protein
MTWDFIDEFEFNLSQDAWSEMLKDYGVLLGMDFHRFTTAVISQDKNIVDEEFDRINKVYSRKLNPQKKLSESLADLRDMGGLLNSYNCGLESITETLPYQKLKSKIKSLQRKSPSMKISTKVNDYFYWSEGLYSILLSIKPLTEFPKSKMPTKVSAKKSQIRPIIEGQINNLISGVRESIIEYKDRNKNSPKIENP